ncbi:uncharacterized protein LOC105286113 isoform X2 [Ooceraea biroi]|uniref:uncharacterized protein LOC105286113 isoform X2 n=1 Tax=Ooceraea biroi TaxID=2015173 RepID=UPI0005BD6825|nr:uncharacterized protein LOC105286113 isoform X2 [Ooceraea biroi]
MLRILALAVLLRSLCIGLSSDVISYTRVSKNGQLARSSHDSLSWLERPSARNDTRVENENRSINDVVSITMSPVYSTLDREMIAKLDAMTGKHRQIQHRFHAPATFEHANGKPQKSTSSAEGTSSMNSSPFAGPLAPDVYEYSPPGFSDSELPVSKPMISKYPTISTDEQDFPQDSYRPSPDEYHTSSINNAHETDYPAFDVAPYGSDKPTPKPMKFTNHHDDQQASPPFADDSYDHHSHHDDFYHHDLIYDHVPEFYDYHHHKTTTEEPEMNDERLDKRPYSYYFIGKKLWYIPLYFSIYFIIYIAALVLKSIARHKINFPTHLADAVTHRKRSEPGEGWWSLAERILEGAERFAETSYKSS